MGFDLVVATPSRYRPLPAIVETAQKNAGKSGGRIKITEDPKEAVLDADIIYTDVWTSMGREKEKKERRRIFVPYQVNSSLVKLAKPGAMIMHCLPAYRGEEITAKVLEGEQSVILEQAENRLHAQKALLALLMGD